MSGPEFEIDRFEQVAQVEAHARLVHGHRLAQFVCSSQMLEGCRRVAKRELDEPEHPAIARLCVAVRLGLWPSLLASVRSSA